MIIYNISTQVTWAIHEEWKQWLLSDYLPSIIATGLFSHYQVTRLMEINEEEGPTYAVQLYSLNNILLTEFRTCHLKRFQHSEKSAWGDSAYSFTTVMEVVN